MKQSILGLRRAARATRLRDWLDANVGEPEAVSPDRAQQWNDEWPFLKDWFFNPEELFTARLPADQESVYTETFREKGWNGQLEPQ